jgi:acyl dehydratase
MPLNRAFVGRSFPAGAPYEVGREKIREFADAIGDQNPVYRSTEAARALGHPDVIAPPTFAIVLTYRLAAFVLDPDLGLDYSRVVHGEQHFTHHRPIHAGESLVGTPCIVDIRDAGRNELLTWEAHITTTAGDPVCTARSTLVCRGTAGGG